MKSLSPEDCTEGLLCCKVQTTTQQVMRTDPVLSLLGLFVTAVSSGTLSACHSDGVHAVTHRAVIVCEMPV